MTRLSGVRILVVEDEALVAALVADTLEEHGAEVVGPTGRLADAVELAQSAAVDLALLDVNLRGERVDPVAGALERRGIPFVFASGQGSAPDARWASVPLVEKPYTTEALTRALEQALQSRA